MLTFILFSIENLHSGPIIMYVDDGGGNTPPYTTIGNAANNIQTAVDYISTINGGGDLTATGSNAIIYVADGSYVENVNINGYVTSPAYDIKLIRFSGTPLVTGWIDMNDPNTTVDGLSVTTQDRTSQPGQTHPLTH